MTDTVDSIPDQDDAGQSQLDDRVLLLADEDNIVVARIALAQGETITLEGGCVTLSRAIDPGFKLARHAIAAGDKISKYGAPIGSATDAIPAGELVHVHNMKSDYLPTYTQDGEARFTTRRTS